MADPRVDGDRLLARLDAFAAIGATAAGGVNRQALSPEDRAARALLADLARARGFTVEQDAMANLFVTRPGRGDGSPFVIGSHLDSQIAGGRFDGALGTLAAFETLEALEDAGAETACPVMAVAWTNEEGSRFQPGCMGSIAFTSGAIPADWADLADGEGSRLADALAATLASLDVPRRPLGGPVRGYLELHIEQGQTLEAEGLPIGAVEAVQGTRWLEVAITGRTAHAGTTARAFRRDALAAAAAAIHRLHADLMPGDASARFTVGRIAVAPGAINAIPENVTFTVDIRHPSADGLDGLEAGVAAAVAAASAANGCTAAIRRLFDMAPCRFDPGLVATVEEAARGLGLGARRMISGAFHDALFLARVAPAAMIFVPSRDGLSHNEAEYTAPAQCVDGARVLLAATSAAAR